MKIQFFGKEYDITLREEEYLLKGRTAIVAMCQGERFGSITTNLFEEELKDGEFFVRIHSEGVWIKQLLAAGVFTDTGRKVKSGFVTVPVWKRGPNYYSVLEGEDKLASGRHRGVSEQSRAE